MSGQWRLILNKMTAEIDTGHRFFPQYEPKQDLLRAFCRENEVAESPPKLPSPWPASAATMAWTAQDLTKSHITHISEAQRVEIAAACNAYRGAFFASPPKLMGVLSHALLQNPASPSTG